MKPVNIMMKRLWVKTLFFLIFVMMTNACQNDDSAMQDVRAMEIDEYIQTLQYDPKIILNVQSTGGEQSSRTEMGAETLPEQISGGSSIKCSRKSYSLKSNFDQVAILRPTNGVVFPGALVYGDASLLDGAPIPLQTERAPATLRIDLPGIGEQGNITINDFSNSSVQSEIDKALDWWNENTYREGYVNPAHISYAATSSYSSQQLALDLGMNASWAGTDVAAQFNHTSSTEKKVAMMAFKQGFYSITMDTPGSPSEVFYKDVDANKIRNMISSDKPAAYVQSVVYGRIIMFRMETTSSVSSSDLEIALKYATGVSSVSADSETHIKNILEKSTTTVITLGGNAAVASNAVSAQNFGDLQAIIKGENAVYSKKNPGVPIAYIVKYLKDNTIAKMGYTTDYTVEECENVPVPGAKVTVYNKTGPGAEIGWDIRFTIKYKALDGKAKTISSGKYSKGKKVEKSIPDGAHDISFEVEYLDGTSWKNLSDKSWSVPSGKCYEVYGSWELFGSKVPKFRNCP